MTTLELVKLTVCGPSDVAKEVEIVKKVIDDWNRVHAESRGLTIKHHHWTTDTFPDAAKSAQNAINVQIIDTARILVAVFWSRIGTPTSVAQSGTIEEIRRGLTQNRKVLIYFSNLEPLPSNTDEEQFEKLWQFRQELRETNSCWSFQSRSEFREQFTTHLALAMNTFEPALNTKSPKKPVTKITQKIKGSGNLQVVGDGNKIHHYQNPPVIKTVLERRAGSVTPEQEVQLTKWITELAEGTLNKSRSEAFSEWGGRFNKRFDIPKREAMQAVKMREAEEWFRIQRAMQKGGYKAKAPDQWRSSRIVAIKAAMRAMGKDKTSYYSELSVRLKMRMPFTSVTKLTKIDLGRVYNMVLRDARDS